MDQRARLIDTFLRLQQTMVDLGCGPAEVRLTGRGDVDRLRALFLPQDLTVASMMSRTDNLAGTKFYADQPDHPAERAFKGLALAAERQGFDVLTSIDGRDPPELRRREKDRAGEL